MAVLERGSPPHERRRDRARLSVRDPLIERLVLGLGVEGETLENLREICKSLVRDRNQFDIARRRTGLFGSNRIRREDADRVLKRQLAALAEGGGE